MANTFVSKVEVAHVVNDNLRLDEQSKSVSGALGIIAGEHARTLNSRAQQSENSTGFTR